MVPLAPPSGPKEGPSQTTSSKEQERTPSSSARLSGRGRALPTPALTSSRKPGQPDEVYSPASQQVPIIKKWAMPGHFDVRRMRGQGACN
ncbi:hypothetical protein HPB47_012157, partial [Ixodes persulcatus]